MEKSKLESLEKAEIQQIITKLLLEQVILQRDNLHFFRDLTFQPAQIDTGYIAQHLVSLVTRIPGGGFRGKGDDLADGSEVKSANFLDSMLNLFNLFSSSKIQFISCIRELGSYGLARDPVE